MQLLHRGFVLQFLALAFTVATIRQSYAAEGFGYQLLQDILDDAFVDIQERDALYPITRYAGMGYNLLRGNPEGDFKLGGKDPGIKNTRWIFNLTYSMNREGYYGDMTVAIPDQVEFHPTQSCAAQSSTRAYSGQTSYHNELQRNVNGGTSVGYQSIAKLGFSLSTGMTKVEETTKNRQQVIIQTTKICNLGSVRYKDELITDAIDPHLLSQGFKNAVRMLPQHFELLSYMDFVENWGTHVILSAQLGTRHMQKKTAKYSDVYASIFNQNSIGGSLNVGGGAFGVSASGNVGIDLKKINKNINTFKRLDTPSFEANVGTDKSPAPIKLTLTPIAEVLSQSVWGPTWDDLGIASKQINLKQALNLYPAHVGASIDKDPQIKAHPKLIWLRGTFALPAPASGCPEGFHTGSITQDTYNLFNNNNASYGITQRLKVSILKGSITTNFCIKTNPMTTDHEELIWPKGSYCIGQRDKVCPDGFSDGFIKWDDKDFRNKNKRKGELPEGKYDKNTLINFCCRSDYRSPRNPILMPTEVPFVLYRYNEQCQEVKGMIVQKDFILWNNEFSFNKDETSGSFPDEDGGKRKHKLHYCHYSPESKK